ncbi:4397_t:CDS:1, partial [Dentiscutata heterogama]
SKHKANTTNRNLFIQAFYNTYLNGNLPIGFISTATLPPFQSSSQATQLAPEFYDKLVTKIREKI